MIFFDDPSDEYGCLCNDEQVHFTVGIMGFHSVTQYLNYSLRDLEQAMHTAESLTERGFHVWYDRSLRDYPYMDEFEYISSRFDE